MSKELIKTARENSQVEKDVASGKVEQGTIYVTINRKLVQIDILDLVYKGTKINDYIVELMRLRAENKVYEEQITKTCKKHKVEYLSDIRYIDPTKHYIVVDLNGEYICKGNKYIVELSIPESEIYKGYCMINNHKIVIDHMKKIEYTNTLGGVI